MDHAKRGVNRKIVKASNWDGNRPRIREKVHDSEGANGKKEKCNGFKFVSLKVRDKWEWVPSKQKVTVKLPLAQQWEGLLVLYVGKKTSEVCRKGEVAARKVRKKGKVSTTIGLSSRGPARGRNQKSAWKDDVPGEGGRGRGPGLGLHQEKELGAYWKGGGDMAVVNLELGKHDPIIKEIDNVM